LPLTPGWGSSDSDTSARASRGAWSPQGFRWWFTIAIAEKTKDLVALGAVVAPNAEALAEDVQQTALFL
jgi:hypothetical protein